MIIGGLAMDKLVMNGDFTVNEFLDQMLDAKEKSGQDIIGEIDGLSVSTEGCTTRLQLQNKVAREMKNYINGERNMNPTKRQQDEMTMMLDESIIPRADWDDPNDVLDWIYASEKHLNEPEFARTVYADGKTSAETMVEMLKSHGYGEMSENLSEAEREINAKISDLENYGFLASDLFDGDEIDLSEAQSLEEPPKTEMGSTGEVEPAPYQITIPQQEDEENYQVLFQGTSEFGGESDDEYGHGEYEDGFVPLTSNRPDPSMLTMNQIESANISKVEEKSGSDISDDQEKMREILQSQQEKLQRMRQDTEKTNTTDEMQQEQVSDEVTTGDNFFAVRPKEGESEELLQIKSKDIGTESGQEIDQFFEAREKDSVEGELFTTKSKGDSLGNEKDNEFFQVKPKDIDVKELEEFQEKYGPTANFKEMQIVKRIEKELVELTKRRKEIKEELVAIQEELKQPSKVVSGSERIANRENKTTSDLAIHEAMEKIRLSTTATKNNDAVVAFYKATETHSVIDIIRTSNAIEALGSDHLLSTSLTHALEEMSKTYYDETIEQLKEDLMEGSKALTEANQLLATNPDENVYDDQIVSVREALKSISIDRSKEKIMQAVMQVGALEENNPYIPTIMNALDKISNLYYGRTAEEIKNQILNSSRACNEAQEELQRLSLREKENSIDDALTQTELDAHYVHEALQKAVMNHSKENILEAASLAQKLDSKEPSKAAIDKALNSLAVTHLNKNLTELRWEDAKVAIEEARTSTNANAQEAMLRFNQATKSYTKADIIVALNMAKEAECPELVSALNKMAIAYYGVDASVLTSQFRNYSKALSEVQDLISSNEIPKDAKENEVMPLFHKAVQSKSEEDIMNALNAANDLPSYHPLKKPITDALNAQLVLVTREQPMTFEEPVIVNDNKKELQKKATALLQEYQKVDGDIKKRQNDLNQYAKNKQKEKEKLQEPPARVINETTNKNPNIFKKACAGAKEALAQMSLKKVASTVVKAAALGTAAYFAPIPLAIGYVGYRLLRNPEKAKQQKEENQQARKEKLQSIRNAFLLEDDEDLSKEELDEAPLEQEEPVQQNAPVEQVVESATNQEEIEFYKAVDDSEGKWWDIINSQEELIHEVVEGSRIGVSINQGKIQDCSNEEVMNYLHNGTFELSEEEKENQNQYDEEVKRGR